MPGDQLLYQIICLWDTPPLTGEEQQSCLHAAGGCWRMDHPASCRNGQNGHKAGASEPPNGQHGQGEGPLSGSPAASGEEKRNGRPKARNREEPAREA
jgi:hypothetical protein